MNWKDIKNIIRKEVLKEAEVKAGGSAFNLRMGVNKNKTKLGIKIQFEPKNINNPEGLSKYMDLKPKLEVALQEKLNDGLGKYKMQISKDTDVPRDEVIGFFIPLDQIKALVVEGLGQGEASAPDAPLAPAPTDDDLPPESEEDEIQEMISKEMISEMKVRDLNEASRIVKKDDFYGFINCGNNIIRDMEAAGKTVSEAKKYLAYLTKHNIM